MSILYHVFPHLSRVLQPFFFQLMELASEEDTLCNQCGNKHGTDNGEGDHRRRRFLPAKRIFERLRDEEGFTGGYDSVKKYVKKIRDEIKSKVMYYKACTKIMRLPQRKAISKEILTRRRHLVSPLDCYVQQHALK